MHIPLSVSECRPRYQDSLIEVTLALAVRDGKLLLARKLKGVGKGLWNGPGGKLEPGESPEEAMVRECLEEVGIRPTEYGQVAVNEFYFPYRPALCMKGYIFMVTAWEGEPTASDEMGDITWFPVDGLPYSEMWEDDAHWLPMVLKGDETYSYFVFDDQNKMVDRLIEKFGRPRESRVAGADGILGLNDEAIQPKSTIAFRLGSIGSRR